MNITNSRIIISIFVLFIALSLACCDTTTLDGDWDPIQITVNGKVCKSATYNISSTGGEYKIYSKNYGSLWLNDVAEDSTIVWPDSNDVWLDFMHIHLIKEWYEVQYDSIGNIVVNINQKPSGFPTRSLGFGLEYGDAFGSITFQQ